MICNSCGTVNIDSDRFCIACGSKLDREVMTGNTAVASSTCSSCGTINDASDKFCIVCGNKLGQRAQPVRTSTAAITTTPVSPSVPAIPPAPVSPSAPVTPPVSGLDDDLENLFKQNILPVPPAPPVYAVQPQQPVNEAEPPAQLYTPKDIGEKRSNPAGFLAKILDWKNWNIKTVAVIAGAAVLVGAVIWVLAARPWDRPTLEIYGEVSTPPVQLENEIIGLEPRTSESNEFITHNVQLQYLTISAGYSNSLAIRADMSLWAWGDNTSGQIGDGTVATFDEAGNAIDSTKNFPVKVMDDIISVSAGMTHSMALRNDGSLYSWGNNWYGQIGDGTTASSDAQGYIIDNKHIPVKIMDDVTYISAGDFYSMAIRSDGSLWAWGDNTSGQIGDGTISAWDAQGNYFNNNKSTPVKVMDAVVSVSAGYAHSLVIKSDGSLWAWGNNLSGQIGDGTTSTWDTNGNIIDNKISPVRIMEDVLSVSAGTSHSMALKSDGSLWVWGDNSSGQIGDGTVTTTDENWNVIDNNRYFPVKIMDDVISISAGYSHSMAIKTDGSLWVWGDNSSGQIGDGTFSLWDEQGNFTDNNRYSPHKVLDNVVSASAGSTHSMALRADGSLWVWGGNASGQIGDGTVTTWDWSSEMYTMIDNNKYSPVKIMDGVLLPQNYDLPFNVSSDDGDYPESELTPMPQALESIAIMYGGEPIIGLTRWVEHATNGGPLDGFSIRIEPHGLDLEVSLISTNEEVILIEMLTVTYPYSFRIIPVSSGTSTLIASCGGLEWSVDVTVP